MKKNNFFLSLIFLFAVIICVFFIFFISISPYDELWNFQNIYKSHNGLKLYSDSNVIITPLFYIFGLAFLKIFGATIISFRIYNIVLYAILFFIIYHVFKQLKISKHLSIVFLCLIFTQTFQVINSGANYSIVCFIFVLLGILSYLNLYDKKYFHFLQGFIVFLVFFSKQNIGIYYCLSILIFEFIYKSNFKIFFFNQLKKFITFFIPLIFSLLLLYFNGTLFDFLDYTFGGIFNFGQSNFNISVSSFYIFFCIFILTLYFFIIFDKKTFNKNVLPEENKKVLTLFACVAVGATFSVYPILNNAHFIFIIPFYFFILFYFLDITILEDFFTSEKSIICCYIISALILFLIIVRLLVFCIIEETNFIRVQDSESPFNNVLVSSENYEKINVMTDYIKNKNSDGKNVIIIAYDSALTMIPLKQSNNAFDLVFNGNLGYDGEKKLIEKIKNSNNTEFLIFTNKEDCFWQESLIIREFIINNLTKTGEILDYSVYELEY